MSTINHRQVHDRRRQAGMISTYDVQKLLGGEGGGPAMLAMEQTAEFFPYHVILSRKDWDFDDCIDAVVDHFLETERDSGRWACWLYGGGYQFCFENEQDAVLARLLI